MIQILQIKNENVYHTASCNVHGVSTGYVGFSQHILIVYLSGLSSQWFETFSIKKFFNTEPSHILNETSKERHTERTYKLCTGHPCNNLEQGNNKQGSQTCGYQFILYSLLTNPFPIIKCSPNQCWHFFKCHVPKDSTSSSIPWCNCATCASKQITANLLIVAASTEHLWLCV